MFLHSKLVDPWLRYRKADLNVLEMENRVYEFDIYMHIQPWRVSSRSYLPYLAWYLTFPLAVAIVTRYEKISSNLHLPLLSVDYHLGADLQRQFTVLLWSNYQNAGFQLVRADNSSCLIYLICYLYLNLMNSNLQASRGTKDMTPLSSYCCLFTMVWSSTPSIVIQFSAFIDTP